MSGERGHWALILQWYFKVGCSFAINHFCCSAGFVLIVSLVLEIVSLSWLYSSCSIELFPLAFPPHGFYDTILLSV